MKKFRSHILAWTLLMVILLASSLPAARAVSGSSQQDDALYLPLVMKNSSSVAPTQTSTELIDKDLASGILDANTAAIYKVYTILPDSPLPAKYIGIPDPQADIGLFRDIMERYDLLTPAQKAEANPYLRRPDDPTSALFKFQQRQSTPQTSSGQSGSLIVAAATRPPEDIQWTSITSAEGVKIHYRADINGDNAKASGVATAIDSKIYSYLTTLMGRQWMDDTGCDSGDTVNDGGSGALDIYLLHGITDRGLEISCKNPPSPGWVILNADRALGDETHIGMIQTAAHEMFHTIQDSYSYLQEAGTYLWVQEATAKWMEDYVYPNAQSEQDYAHLYLDKTWRPIDDDPGAGVRYYGEYLWPFYLYRIQSKNPTFMRSMFEQAASNTSVEIFMQKSGSTDPVTLFPDFALKNWNQYPFNEYQVADALTQRVGEVITIDVNGITDKDKYVLAPMYAQIARLSATYYDYKFTDDTARTVAFFNGLSNKLTEAAGNIFFVDTASQYYQTESLPLARYDGINVQALIKINNTWTREDWSDSSSHLFCRDRNLQRLQELVLIVTNSNFKASQANYNFSPEGLWPILQISPTGCYQWTGTFDVTDSSDPNVEHTINGNVTFEASDSTLGPAVIFNMKSGSATLKMQGESSDHVNRFNVDASADFSSSDPASYLDTYNLVTGGPHPNAYYGFGQTNASVTGSLGTCCLEDGSWEYSTESFAIGKWFQTPNPVNNEWISQSVGNVIDGSYTEPNGYMTYHWHLEAKMEP